MRPVLCVLLRRWDVVSDDSVGLLVGRLPYLISADLHNCSELTTRTPAIIADALTGTAATASTAMALAAAAASAVVVPRVRSLSVESLNSGRGTGPQPSAAAAQAPAQVPAQVPAMPLAGLREIDLSTCRNISEAHVARVLRIRPSLIVKV
jgi:hypothetical protein